MLETFRNLQHSWIVKILLIITALSFMSLFGVSGYVNNSNKYEPALKVGDIEISAEEIATQFNRDVQRMRRILGPQVTAEEAKAQGFMDRAIFRAANNAILDMAAKDLEMEIADESIRDQILRLAEFADHTGNFNRNQFNAVLSSLRMTEGEYIELMRGDIRRDHLWSAAYYKAPVPKALLKQLYKYRFEKRSAELVRIKTADMPKPKKPTEKAMAEYLENNGHAYMAPEYRTLTVVAMTPDSVSDRIERKDEDLKAIYDANIADYTKPEKRLVDQIFFDEDKKDEADKAAEELAKGKDFYAVAKDVANQSEKDTNFGWVTHDMLEEALAKAVFDTAPGEHVGPFKSKYGWNIIKVRDIEEKVVKPYDEAKKEIEDRIIREQAFDILYSLSRDFEDELGRGATMEEAAKKFGFKTRKIEFIDPVGEDKKGNKVAEDIATADFLDVAFDTYLDEESRLTEHEKGFFMLRVDEIIDPQPKALELVKDKVEKAMLDEAKAKAAQEKAEEVLGDLIVGEEPKKVAKKMGLEYEVSEPVLRRDTYTLPAALVHRLFNLKKDEPTLVPTKDGYIVARVKDIITPDPEQAEAELDKLGKEVASDLSLDMRTAMVRDFSRFFNFTKNEQVLNQLRK